MTPPRRHYGPRPPGALEATMLKVIAAELSDVRRLSRGKQLFAEDAVTDITVERGRVDAEVQGSRAAPYEVMLATRPGSGVPTGAELAASCDCPDAERVRMCKHAVAALFAFAGEVAIEPELLTTWRGGIATAAQTTPDTNDGGPGDGLAPVVRLFGDDRFDAIADDSGADDSGADDEDDAEWEPDESIAQINSMLLPPSALGGTGALAIPDLGPVVPIRYRSSGDATIDRLLTEIYDEFDLGW